MVALQTRIFRDLLEIYIRLIRVHSTSPSEGENTLPRRNLTRTGNAKYVALNDQLDLVTDKINQTFS